MSVTVSTPKYGTNESGHGLGDIPMNDIKEREEFIIVIFQSCVEYVENADTHKIGKAKENRKWGYGLLFYSRGKSEAAANFLYFHDRLVNQRDIVKWQGVIYEDKRSTEQQTLQKLLESGERYNETLCCTEKLWQYLRNADCRKRYMQESKLQAFDISYWLVKIYSPGGTKPEPIDEGLVGQNYFETDKKLRALHDTLTTQCPELTWRKAEKHEIPQIRWKKGYIDDHHCTLNIWELYRSVLLRDGKDDPGKIKRNKLGIKKDYGRVPTENWDSELEGHMAQSARMRTKPSDIGIRV